MIYNKYFLQQLDAYPHKTTHIRLIAIDYLDRPIEAIEGRVTSGNISISGESAIQRTCSLSIVAAEGSHITDSSWAFKNKFKVEIGVENDIDPSYEPIIWFKQGTFIVKSFSKNVQKDGSISVSISGMDKMCMLNGNIGGTLLSDVNFGEIDEVQANGTVITSKVELYTLIQQAIQQFGNERLENIIINDLPKYGYELWTYRGDEPMYMLRTAGKDGQIVNFTTDQSASLGGMLCSTIPKYYSTNTLDPTYNDDAYNLNGYNIVKIEYGETGGYAPTPMVYAGDLIENAGSTVTTVLDKIAKMLGAYEYFYNVEGQFVFQRKKNYIQEIFSPTDGVVSMPTVLVSPYSYEFNDKSLMTSLSYTPAIDKIKNDFAVWGTTKGNGGAELPIHARCAIQVKPTKYVSFSGVEYIASDSYDSSNAQSIKCDWRELIYQMADDFLKNNAKQEFIPTIMANNPILSSVPQGENPVQVRNGKTGYEQYYTDINGFWRQLYNPSPTAEEEELYYKKDFNDHMNWRCWNKSIHTDPNSLKFWFDFLDPGTGELSQYSVEKIGDRPKVNNSSTVKTIYYKDIPQVLFIPPMKANETFEDMPALSRMNITPETEELFTVSTQGISAIEQLNVEINNNACLGEGISFSTLPIYYLLPNTRIKVLGEDYLLTSISFAFGNNANMNLSGSKIMKSII